MNALVALSAVPSLLVAWIVGFVVRALAPRWNLVDQPGARKVHTRATPYGGGLAIWAGVVVPAALAQGLLLWWWSTSHDPSQRLLEGASLGAWTRQVVDFVEPHLSGLVARSGDFWLILAAGTVLVALGLVDDVRKLDWRLRLVVEIGVAAAIVFGRGWSLTLFIEWPMLTNFASVLWIVWLINAFNMLDNMDGLSAGVAAIAASLLAIVMLTTPEEASGQPQLFVAGFLFLLLGALVGFLFHNRPPARLFMGDAGSYFVGFCLAVATILATFAGGGMPRHAILAPLCVLAVPLYDTLSVISIRLRAGRSPFEGDTSHFSHRLVALGLSKTQAVLTIYLTSAACGLGALLLHQVDVAGAAAILMMIACLLSVIAILETTALGRARP